MIKTIKRVGRYVRRGIISTSWATDRLALVACVCLLAGLVTTVFVSVLVRYFNLSPGSFAWIDESSRFIFVWLSFLGASRAYYLHQHIVINVLVRLFPPPLQFFFEIFATVLSGLFCVVILVQGYRLTAVSFDQISSALEMPMAVVFAALPTSGFLMLLHSFKRLVELDYSSRRPPAISQEAAV